MLWSCHILAGLGQRTSPNTKRLCPVAKSPDRQIWETDCTALRNVRAMNMGRLPRTRNEHKTGQSTVCYRMSNEHKHDKRTNERMKRTNNKCYRTQRHPTKKKTKNFPKIRIKHSNISPMVLKHFIQCFAPWLDKVSETLILGGKAGTICQ